MFSFNIVTVYFLTLLKLFSKVSVMLVTEYFTSCQSIFCFDFFLPLVLGGTGALDLLQHTFSPGSAQGCLRSAGD